MERNSTPYFRNTGPSGFPLGVLVIAVMVFIASYGVLSSLDFVPNSLEASAKVGAAGVMSADAATSAEAPTSISIPSLDLGVTIANPTSSNAEVLDAALLKGAVRYPGTGLLGEKGGNVVVFAHSSYLPVVRNLSYKAFDGIQNLRKGDKIYVTGKDRTYLYSVEGVYKANALTGGVPLHVEGNRLTLITCDSFASKSDRFVVTATLVESYLNTN